MERDGEQFGLDRHAKPTGVARTCGPRRRGRRRRRGARAADRGVRKLVPVVIGLVIGRRVRSHPGQGHARHRQRQGARIQRLSGSPEHATRHDRKVGLQLNQRTDHHQDDAAGIFRPGHHHERSARSAAAPEPNRSDRCVAASELDQARPVLPKHALYPRGRKDLGCSAALGVQLHPIQRRQASGADHVSRPAVTKLAPQNRAARRPLRGDHHLCVFRAGSARMRTHSHPVSSRRSRTCCRTSASRY